MKLFVALIALSIGAYAAEISGKWNLTPTGRDGEAKVRLTIQKTADGYTGMISTNDSDLPMKDLRVNDSQLTFRVDADEQRYEVTATVEGDTMKGSFTVNNNPGRTFTATRDTPAKTNP